MRISARAYIRRWLGIHSVFATIMFCVLLYTVKNWGEALPLTWALFNIGLMLWFLLDFLVIARYALKINPIVDAPVFNRLFFFEGVTWKELARTAAEVNSFIERIASRTARFPDEHARVMEIYRTSGEMRALAYLEELENQAISDAKEAEERIRREERRAREASGLMQKGVTLGIPEIEMASLVAGDVGQAREAVALKERGRDLVERANQYGCIAAVQKCIACGWFDTADSVVITAKAIIERARKVGVEESAKQAIAQADIPLAERRVAQAEEEAAFKNLKERLRMRIEGLPLSVRPCAQVLLDRLDFKQYGTRPFHKVLYDLEQVLSR